MTSLSSFVTPPKRSSEEQSSEGERQCQNEQLAGDAEQKQAGTVDRDDSRTTTCRQVVTTRLVVRLLVVDAVVPLRSGRGMS